MKLTRSFFSLIVLSSALAAQSVEQPKLVVEFAPYVINFHVGGPQEQFLGAVVLSLSPELAHYFTGMPPLLVDFAVLGVGIGEPGEMYSCSVSEYSLQPGVMMYAQGVTFDGAVFQATAVHEFVLDVTVPK